jgi:peptidoglycan/xylan/chitin deacetylase (PgdA/CDA1 family)
VSQPPATSSRARDPRRRPVAAPLRRGAKATLIGLFDLVGRVYSAGGVPILCYHSIDDSGSLLSLREDLFRRQMEFLRARGYTTMALSSLCSALLEKQPLPSRAVVLTFDDGFRNTHTRVLPTLKRLGLTATVFVVTGHVGGPMNWVRTADVPDLELASWDEIKEMSEAGLDIQSHSVTHPNLCRLTLEQVRNEVRASKQEIEQRLGQPVTLFSYPYGEFTPQIERVVEELDFLGAVTLVVGRTHPGDAPLSLKRMNITEVSRVSDDTKMSFFRCCVSGTGTWYSGMKYWLPRLVNHQRPWRTSEGSEGSGHP